MSLEPEQRSDTILDESSFDFSSVLESTMRTTNMDKLGTPIRTNLSGNHDPRCFTHADVVSPPSDQINLKPFTKIGLHQGDDSVYPDLRNWNLGYRDEDDVNIELSTGGDIMADTVQNLIIKRY